MLVVGCAATRSEVVEAGLATGEVRCARTLFIGEPPHPGVPHVPMEPAAIERVTSRIRKDIPSLRVVRHPDEADLVISVITSPKRVCTHCESESDVQWAAVVERGGQAHGVGQDVLLLSGEVRPGVNPIRTFVAQLGMLIDCPP
jgi:hypothetical protein